MGAVTESADEGQTIETVAMVDPRAPRFGQTITTIGLVASIGLQRPVLIFAVTAILLTAVVSRWRYDPYGLLWKYFVKPIVTYRDPEPVAPHRFAKLLGAVGTTLASAFILAGIPLVGYVVAGAVALAAGLAAATGICLGCRMYRGVSLFRRLNVV